MQAYKEEKKLIGINVLAQVVPICALPFLTDLYGLKQFDQLALFIATINISSIIMTLRLDISLPQIKSSRLAAITESFVLLCSIILTFAILSVNLVVGIFDDKILDILYPLCVGLVSIYSLQVFSLTRKKLVKETFYLKFFQVSLVSGLQISLIYLIPNENGLIFAVIAGYTASVAITSFYYGIPRIRLFKLSEYIASVKRNQNYIRYSLPDSLINALNQNLPIFIFSYYSFESLSALYFMALKLFYTPMSLVTSVYAKLFQAKLREYALVGKMTDLIANTIKKVLILTSSFCIFYILFFGFIIDCFFDDAWSSLYLIVIYFIPWVLMQSVVSPISTALIFSGKQKYLFQINLAFLLAKLALVVIALRVGINPFLAIGLSGFIMYSVLLVKITRVYKLDYFHMIKPMH